MNVPSASGQCRVWPSTAYKMSKRTRSGVCLTPRSSRQPMCHDHHPPPHHQYRFILDLDARSSRVLLHLRHLYHILPQANVTHLRITVLHGGISALRLTYFSEGRYSIRRLRELTYPLHTCTHMPLEPRYTRPGPRRFFRRRLLHRTHFRSLSNIPPPNTVTTGAPGTTTSDLECCGTSTVMTAQRLVSSVLKATRVGENWTCPSMVLTQVSLCWLQS